VDPLVQRLLRERVAHIRQRHVRQRDAADPLDAHHPRAGLRQVHREGADDEEERPEAQAIERHRAGAERHVARRRDPAEQTEEERAYAGRRNEPADEAEEECASVAGSAHAR
jgi:hypothetical protein